MLLGDSCRFSGVRLDAARVLLTRYPSLSDSTRTVHETRPVESERWVIPFVNMERVPTIPKDHRHAAGCHGPALRPSDTVPCNDDGDDDVTIFIAYFFQL